jgi:hypothetical protein
MLHHRAAARRQSQRRTRSSTRCSSACACSSARAASSASCSATRFPLRVNIGFIIDAEEAGEIRVRYTPTADHVADFLTAAEDRDRFVRNRTVALGGV